MLDKLGFGIILTPDNRSKAYIQKLLSSHIFPDVIIFMNNNIPEKTYTLSKTLCLATIIELDIGGN